MELIHLIILIVVFIVIFTIIVILLSKNRKLNVKGINIQTNNEAEQIQTIHTELVNAFNLILNNISNVSINSGGITGTLDNLQLNDVISGTGTQDLTVLDLNYDYKNLVLLNFTKDLKFTNTHIKINDINPNGDQIITLYATANAKQLQCKITAHAYIDLIKIGVFSRLEGDCTNIPIRFNDVVCNIEINFKLSGCGSSPRLSDMTLERMDISFASVNIYCDLVFKYLNIIDFPITRLNISSYLLDTIRRNMYRIKNALAPLFNREFKNINIPLLFCIQLNPGCILGIDIKPQKSLSLGGFDNITWNECVSLCNSMADCNYVYHNVGPGDNRGKCLFFNTIGPRIEEAVRGYYYDKKTGEIKRGIPLSYKTAVYHGKTTEFNGDECYRICKSEKYCYGMTYENGICSFYGDPIDNQNVTLDLSKCQRNMLDPNSFY